MRYVRLNDYKCTVCDTKEINQEVPPKCPKCGKLMWKIFPSVGIVYKDTGYTGAQKGKEGRDGN